MVKAQLEKGVKIGHGNSVFDMRLLDSAKLSPLDFICKQKCIKYVLVFYSKSFLYYVYNFDMFGIYFACQSFLADGYSKCKFAPVAAYLSGNFEYHARRVATQYPYNFQQHRKERSQSNVSLKIKKPSSSIGTQDFYKVTLKLLFSFFIIMISRQIG